MMATLGSFSSAVAPPAVAREGVPLLVRQPAQPGQPASGPGGRDYRFEDVHVDRIGSRPNGATLFRPEGISDADLAGLPVVVFLHGFTAVEPQRYGGWIEHLVRRGAVVIYPDYQNAGLLAGGQDRYVDNMFAGIASGLDALGTEPERVHVAGHSLGAALAMMYGLDGPARGLPPAASLTLVAPGGCRTCDNSGGFGVDIPLDRNLPADTLVSIVTGADDTLVGTADAEAFSRMAVTLPANRQRSVMVASDDHGEPALVADHLFAQTAGRGGEEDALDWFALWRPLDALIACADAGRECDVALGTSASALSLGAWSDGTPVRPLQVLPRSANP